MFLMPLRIYYEDTDSGGVVYYANYLRFMERARSEWLRSCGVEQDDLLSSEGLLFAVRSISVDYLSPGRFNDLLHVSAEPKKIGRASMNFVQQVVRLDRTKGEQRADGLLPEDELLCQAEVRIACISAGDMRPCAIPATLLGELKRVS